MKRYDLIIYRDGAGTGGKVDEHPTGSFYKVKDVDKRIARLEANCTPPLEVDILVGRIAELEDALSAMLDEFCCYRGLVVEEAEDVLGCDDE